MTFIYKDLIADEQRTRQVIADVTAALSQGRNCLVLTNWTAHLGKFADALRAMGHDPVVLRGGMGAKARAAALARLQPGGPPLLAVATGPYAGEEFDCPGLDTLFLASPVALPSLTGHSEGTAPPVRRPHPSSLRRQGHRRGPRLPRRTHRRARLITGQACTRPHQPRLPRPPAKSPTPPVNGQVTVPAGGQDLIESLGIARGS